MSIFAPSRPGGSAQGFLPPDGRPCKAEKSSRVTPVPPEDVSALGDTAAGTQGAAPPIRAGQRPGGAAPLPRPADSGVPPARSHPWLRGPRRAGLSQRPRPRPLPPPGPAPAPHRCAPKLPCPPGRQRRCGARKRRASAHPPATATAGPPPTRGGEREEEELRPAGSGRGCALPGSPPGGRRGGCRRPSVTARQVPRPRGIAGAADATEGRGAHVGLVPRSPTLSRRRPRRPGTDGAARRVARQHAALAGLRAAAERRAQRRLCRGEYAGAGCPGLRDAVLTRHPLTARRRDATGRGARVRRRGAPSLLAAPA